MDSETGEWLLADRHVKEGEFFSHGIWEELSRSLLGVDKLRNRLSKVLLRQIAAELPSLIDEIKIKSYACRNRLAKLGETRCRDPQIYPTTFSILPVDASLSTNPYCDLA